MRYSTLAQLFLAAPVLSAAVIRDADSTAANRTATEAKRAAAVVTSFRKAWSGYKQYAFPADQLNPVSNTSSNPRNGWGASAVDAFSTAIVMEQADIVEEILDFIPTINYSYTNESCSLFETTIRYLAGMLSGYDLLTGPFANLTSNATAVDGLITQAKNLADVLKFAFNTTTGIPYNDLNITAQTFDDSTPQNGLATIGSLVMEWTRLSDITGDTEYATLAQKGESYLLNPQPAWAEPFPGLVGTNVNITSGEFLDASGGWLGGDDSFYEYLIKMYVYDQSRFGTYKDRWTAAADSSIEYLISPPPTRPEAIWFAAYNNQTLVLESEHLACFNGGNFILGGAVLGEQKYIDTGLALTDACHLTYNSTASHIGPEVFGWDNTSVPAGQEDFYAKNGFYVLTYDYDLRPEVLESYYYAYRATGDKKYQDWAWDAFVAINRTTSTPSGFSEINNVTLADGGTKGDDQESFLFAEVMKYAYLIHSADGPWQVLYNGTNDFVFNTECHPFKVSGTPI